MKYYVNIKFGISNKTYYFGTDDASIKIGDFVVLETIVGTEIGEVTTLPRELSTLKFDREIKPITRIATEDDIIRFNMNKNLSLEANSLFEQYTKELNLDMLLLGSQYTLDRTKILFTYAADDRLDFRELLKKLAAALHCRIELKQISSRERAQLIGGIGVCGLPLCCTTFLHQFEGVSLNKAKNQMLSINIPKLSGQCGKLMCCLKYEDDLYTEEKSKFPQINTKVIYQGEEYKVATFNIFTKVIKITSKENAQFITLDEYNAIQKKSNFSSKHDFKNLDEINISASKPASEKEDNIVENNTQNSQKPCKTPTNSQNSQNNSQNFVSENEKKNTQNNKHFNRRNNEKKQFNNDRKDNNKDENTKQKFNNKNPRNNSLNHGKVPFNKNKNKKDNNTKTE